MNNIHQEKIADHLCKKFGISKNSAMQLTKELLKEILAITSCDHAINITNFGQFKISYRKPKKILNIQHKELTTTREKKILQFTPSNKIKNLINTI